MWRLCIGFWTVVEVRVGVETRLKRIDPAFLRSVDAMAAYFCV